MRTFCAVLALAVGCGGEPQPATNTIAPADPRPAPPVTSTVGSRPVITTAGSPRPASADAPGTTFVTVESGRIEVQPLLPRAHTVFHVRNRTGVAHRLVLQGATGSVAASLPANGSTVMQLRLGAGAYELACVTPGHQEQARFETYAPGVPLTPAADRERGR